MIGYWCKKELRSGVAQWIGRWPANQGVCWFDSQLGHMPGLGARSPAGGVRAATTH